MNDVKIHLRNGSLEDLLAMLKEQEARKLDLVVPSTSMYSEGGIISLTDDGSMFDPNHTMHGHIASKLDIPMGYYRRMRDTLPDLFDVTVNDWLSTKDISYLIRSFLDDSGSDVGIGRAMLSSSYKVIDNMQILEAMLRTIMDKKMGVSVASADIDERRMYVRFQFNDIATDGGLLTENYRNPNNKQVGDTVSSGFTLSNSEVGHGAFSLLPRLDILICNNGMLRNALGMKKTHLGAKLDDGVIDYSANTKQKNVDLIMSQMQDFIGQISSQEYLQSWVDELNGKVGRELNNPIETTRLVSGMVGMSENETDAILNYFSQSADMTSNGILQAMTFLAHEVESPERQFDIERKASEVLDIIPTIDI